MAIGALERLDIEQTSPASGPMAVGRPAAACRHCPGAGSSEMLLADEPMASLDPRNARMVMDALAA